MTFQKLEDDDPLVICPFFLVGFFLFFVVSDFVSLSFFLSFFLFFFYSFLNSVFNIYSSSFCFLFSIFYFLAIY